MSDSTTKPSFNVYRRWGLEISEAGYTAVPNILVYANRHLEGEMKLSPSEFWLLAIVLSCWRDKSLPQPSKKFIADRMGVSERQVQRIIRSLEGKRLIYTSNRHERPYKSNEFHLDGLMRFIQYVVIFNKEYKRQGRKDVVKVSKPNVDAYYHYNPFWRELDPDDVSRDPTP